MSICKHCGHEQQEPDRVSIWGIYDMHLFHKYDGSTVDEVIDNWLAHISEPILAIVGERKIDDMGPTDLCPAVVLAGEIELRQVGKMVHVRKDRKPDQEDIESYRQALLADPDIPRLLAMRANAKFSGR